MELCKHSANEVQLSLVSSGDTCFCRLCNLRLPESTLHSWQRSELEFMLSTYSKEQRLVTLLSTFWGSLKLTATPQGISVPTESVESKTTESIGPRVSSEAILPLEVDALRNAELDDKIYREYGGVCNDSETLQAIDFAATPLDTSELLQIPGVYWAKLCHDYRRAQEIHNTVLAVGADNWATCFEAVKQMWANNPAYRHFPLTVFHMGEPDIAFNRDPAMRAAAVSWWNTNIELVQDLFKQHSGLVSAFVDPPERQVLNNEMSLVLVVQAKGFGLLGDALLPKTLNGISTDVRTGLVLPVAATAHCNAWDSGDPTCFIGRSVGPESQLGWAAVNKYTGPIGTIGAVVQDNNNGELCGLTCAHVVGDSPYVTAPASIDQYHPTFARHTEFKLDVSKVCDDIRGGTRIDAALLRCMGKRVKPSEWQECDPAECWAPRTNRSIGKQQPKFFHQSGRIEAPLTTFDGKYRYFGRTSGPTDVEFVLSQETLVRAQDTAKLSVQLLMNTAAKQCLRVGDSGSVVWRVHEDTRSLDAVGLLSWRVQKKPGHNMAHLLLATPIGDVLREFDCGLIRFDTFPHPVPTAAVTTTTRQRRQRRQQRQQQQRQRHFPN